MIGWNCVLELNTERHKVAGSEAALADAIRRGCDLRIYTEFIHNEHIDVTSDSTERIREVAEFGITYLLEDSWTAGIMSLRQPVSLPDGFGPRPSMSFFLYNQNGQQAIARPHLDGQHTTQAPSALHIDDHTDMPKYHPQDGWDGQTNAPSQTFIYDFDLYRFYVRDEWREVLSHDAKGAVQSGSVHDLADAFSQGCEVKVGVRGLCADLTEDPTTAIDHEMFVQTGSCYYYTAQQLFIAGTHPTIRVKPTVPLVYTSQGWDFGWLMVRTDGLVIYRHCDPYTLAFEDIEGNYPIRWFVR